MNTANVLPFAKPCTRTSPQPDSASVGVKHTAPDCEAVRDMFKQARIRIEPHILARVWRALWVANDPGERAAWDAFMAADRKAKGLR